MSFINLYKTIILYILIHSLNEDTDYLFYIY